MEVRHLYQGGYTESQKRLKVSAFSAQSLPKIPFSHNGGMIGMFLYCKKLFNIDQYFVGPKGSKSFFPFSLKYLSFASMTSLLDCWIFHPTAAYNQDQNCFNILFIDFCLFFKFLVNFIGHQWFILKSMESLQNTLC